MSNFLDKFGATMKDGYHCGNLQV